MDFSHLHVEFFMDAVEDKAASAKEGRPIFNDVEMVRIRIAGDPKTVLVAPANDGSSVRDPSTNQRLTYAQLHAEPYRAFKDGVEYIGSGTPLSELPFITKAKAEELKRLNVHTAEALAGLDGPNLQKLGMHARDMKEQAEAYLAKAAGSADIVKLSGENAALKEQIAALQAQMKSLTKSDGAHVDPPENSAGVSPFETWADEDIINWIVDHGGTKPHHACSHETIVAKADELNAELEKQSEAA